MKSQKVTKEGLTPRRSYEDACGAAHALDLVGERWALLVMRELMLGPKRFSDLRHDLPGISANVLTQRLEGLEAAGVDVVFTGTPPAIAAAVYGGQPLASLEAAGALSVEGDRKAAKLFVTLFPL